MNASVGDTYATILRRHFVIAPPISVPSVVATLVFVPKCTLSLFFTLFTINMLFLLFNLEWTFKQINFLNSFANHSKSRFIF